MVTKADGECPLYNKEIPGSQSQLLPEDFCMLYALALLMKFVWKHSEDNEAYKRIHARMAVSHHRLLY